MFALYVHFEDSSDNLKTKSLKASCCFISKDRRTFRGFMFNEEEKKRPEIPHRIRKCHKNFQLFVL